ncbi:MAG: SAM-dependent methyltransferase [Defluviitaleaceae bacterium]|nr:SAM-dependent methyltransferase [Defluviitaleaceae bacterium]
MGRQQIKCHGDEKRFEAIAEFIYQRFGKEIKYIADVGGGQGLLSRILSKKYNYEAEVIDPRGYVLKGVASRQSEYTADMAQFYDLIVGLHPDGATRDVVESAKQRPILLVPCCNEWDKTQKLGSKELVQAIVAHLDGLGVDNEVIVFDFKGPKNVGIVCGGTG